MSSFVDSAEFERLLERIAADDSSLTEVDLGWKRIGDAGAIRLAEALRGNTHVTALNLGRNRIGDDGVVALAEALRGNSTLTRIWLWGNSIGAEGAVALAEMLSTNSTVTRLDLYNNSIGDEGATALVEALRDNCTLTWIGLAYNSISDDLQAKVERLLEINKESSSPEEARRLKIERRIGWMLDSEDGSEYEAAVSLAVAELESFPEAERRRGLFERLLGSTERGADVAASVDAEMSRALYWYTAECGAGAAVLMNLLRAHPSLCVCRDVRHKLYPFMLVATFPEAGPDDVMEALLLSPSLVESGISRTVW